MHTTRPAATMTDGKRNLRQNLFYMVVLGLPLCSIMRPTGASLNCKNTG